MKSFSALQSKKLPSILSFKTQLLLFSACLLPLIFSQTLTPPACPVAYYPKVLGGSFSDTRILQIDVHAMTTIAASGWTQDSGLKLGDSNRVPYIAQFQNAQQAPQWGVWLSKPNFEAAGVVYSTDGVYIIALCSNNGAQSFLIMIKSADGTLVGNPQEFTNSLAQFNNERRTTILNTGSTGNHQFIMSSSFSPSAGSQQGYQTFSIKIDVSGTVSFTYLWALKSLQITSSDVSLALILRGTSLFELSYQNGKTTLTCLDSATGTQSWALQYDEYQHNQGTLSYLKIDSTKEVLFVMTGPATGQKSYTQIFITNGNVDYNQNKIYSDTKFSNGAVIKGSFISNQDEVSVLIQQNDQLSIQRIYFPNKLTQKLTLFMPQISALTTPGILYNLYEFLIAFTGQNINTNDIVGTQTIGSSPQGIIFNSNDINACYRVSYSQDSERFTEKTTTYSAQISNLYQTQTVTFTPLASLVLNNLDLTQVTNIEPWCKLKPYYKNFVTTQANQRVYYFLGKNNSFYLTPFTADIKCDNIPPIFKYSFSLSGYNYVSGDPGPSNMLKFDELTGQYFINGDRSYDFTLQFNGQLQDFSVQQTWITVKCWPTFSQDLTQQQMLVFGSKDYVLPGLAPNDLEQFPYIENIYYSKSNEPLPSDFASYDNSTQTIKLRPQNYSYVGDNQVYVKVSFGGNSNEYKFNVVITNFPPYFQSNSLVSKTLELYTDLNYTSFPVIDPENQPISLFFDPNPGFINYDSESKTLMMKPRLPVHQGYHTVQVTLFDGKDNSTKTQAININVTNTPPYFKDASLLTRLTVKINDIYYYKLPEIVDLKNLVVAVQLDTQSYSNFVSLYNDLYLKITPNEQKMLWEIIKVTGKLNDSIDTTPFEFEVEVISDPPYFTSDLVNQTVNVGGTLIYNLPKIIDNQKQKYAVLCNELTTQLLPDYISCSPNLIVFSPSLDSDVGNYTLQVNLTDYYSLNKNYTMNYTVLPALIIPSKGKPPYFQTDIPTSLNLTVGKPFSLKLPLLMDSDDGDIPSILGVKLGAASPFTVYENGIINFKPIKSGGPFEVKITLTDQRQTTKAYTISVLVNEGDISNDNKDSSQNDAQSQQQSRSQSLKSSRRRVKQNITIQSNTKRKLIAIIQDIDSKGVVIIKFYDKIDIPQNWTQKVNSSVLDIAVIPNRASDFPENKTIFNWNVSEFSSERIVLQLNFTYPLAISPKIVEQDELSIIFIDNSIFVRTYDKYIIDQDEEITFTIPQQVIYTRAIVKMEKMATVGSKTMTYGVLGNVFLQIFISISMGSIWSIMNTLQLISFIHKFNLIIPGNLFLFLKYIQDFNSMKAQLIDDWFDYFTAVVLKIKRVQDGEFPEDANSIKSLAMILIACVGIIAGILLVFAIKKLSQKYNFVNMIYLSLKSKIFYSSILRIGIQYYFKFCMLTFVTLKTGLSFSPNGGLANSVTALVLLLIVIGYPIFTFVFLKIKQASLQQEEYKSQFQTLYMNINTQTWPLIMPTAFLIRRMILALCIVFLQKFPCAQIIVLLISNMAIFSFNLRVKPFETERLNRLEVFNESTLLFVSCSINTFTDTYTLDQREIMGWVVIVLTTLNVAVTLGLIVKDVVTTLWGKISSRFIEKQKLFPQNSSKNLRSIDQNSTIFSEKLNSNFELLQIEKQSTSIQNDLFQQYCTDFNNQLVFNQQIQQEPFEINQELNRINQKINQRHQEYLKSSKLRWQQQIFRRGALKEE